MRLRNHLAVVTSLLALVLLCWTAVVAQQTYPSTGQDGFVPASNDWAVTPPKNLDQQTGQHSEMSPDHWGSSAKLYAMDSYHSDKTALAWDADIESHPWLQQDELAGFDPTGFPELNENTALSVSSDPASNLEVPLPPSTTMSEPEIPLPPSATLDSPAVTELSPNQSVNSSPSIVTEPEVYAESAPSFQPEATFEPEPSMQPEVAVDPEPAFTPNPTVNSNVPAQPELNSYPLHPPVAATETVPSLPSMSNDFVPNNLKPKTVDIPNGDYPKATPSTKSPGAISANDSPQKLTPPSYASTDACCIPHGQSNCHVCQNNRRFGRRGNRRQPAMQVSGPSRYPMANLTSNAYSGSGSSVLMTPTPNNVSPDYGCQPNYQPNFRPDLGYRSPEAVVRGTIPQDDGQRFGYEEEYYPKMSEILATGRYFGSVDALLIKPHFQGNTSVAQSDGVAQSFDFDHAFAPRLRMGFESQYGPGVEMTYFQYDQNSDLTTFTSDGVVSGTSSTWMIGPSSWSRLTASGAGDTLDVDHSLEVHQFTASFFKDLQFRRAKLNGIFGFQYVSIAQELSAVLADSGGTELGRLSSRSDMRAFGPRVGFEYYRKIGHTGLVLVNNFGGSVLFGNRDQFVDNSSTSVLSVSGADEFLTILDLGFGVQKHRRIGENRSIFWKIGYVGQTWLGGGTAVHPQDDFGFRGYSFAIGFNR